MGLCRNLLDINTVLDVLITEKKRCLEGKTELLGKAGNGQRLRQIPILVLIELRL
jgi:hypothetical protein